MPFTDFMPALVYPNTREGRREGAAAITGSPEELVDNVYYCSDWEPRQENKAMCRNAYIMGDIQHNMCFRCVCGFMFMQMHEHDYNRQRVSGVDTSGL